MRTMETILLSAILSEMCVYILEQLQSRLVYKLENFSFHTNKKIAADSCAFKLMARGFSMSS